MNINQDLVPADQLMLELISGNKSWIER